ncbi:hypothetical protein JTB14_017868 [Gonioctena quinquepunctata]|nr:hypothetical protein JTB14_017868 [Gonioctena quinquepunctata]
MLASVSNYNNVWNLNTKVLGVSVHLPLSKNVDLPVEKCQDLGVLITGLLMLTDSSFAETKESITEMQYETRQMQNAKVILFLGTAQHTNL